MLTTHTFLLVSAFALANCRGPHHPRGQKIVKHHVHYRPTRGAGQNILEDKELVHDTAHIQEHLEEIMEEPDLSKMTNEELDFYYFQVHDTDKNSKLDGLEILQAIMHTDHHDDAEDSNKEGDDDFSYYIGQHSRFIFLWKSAREN